MRGSALIALEGLSRAHPGDVNAYRPLLHELAARDPNVAVRRLAIVVLQERHARAGDDRDPRRHRRATTRPTPRCRKTAESVALLLVKKSNKKLRVAESPLVGLIMGSRSDWETMRHAAETLDALEVPYEQRVVSAHRTPDLLFEYAGSAEARGLQVLIAGAGGAAHLPGDGGGEDGAAGARRAGRVEDAEGGGLAALDRPDAGRESRSGRWRSAAPGRSMRRCSRRRSWPAATRGSDGRLGGVPGRADAIRARRSRSRIVSTEP